MEGRNRTDRRMSRRSVTYESAVIKERWVAIFFEGKTGQPGPKLFSGKGPR